MAEQSTVQATDSTIETSTDSPRSAEEILDAMKKEDKAQSAGWEAKAKKLGINAKNSILSAAKNTAGTAVDKAVDTGTAAVKNEVKSQMGLSNAAGIAGVGLSAGSAVLNAVSGSESESKDTSAKDFSAKAPDDSDIAAYQAAQNSAKSKGIEPKILTFTDEQQAAWDGTSQNRMYSHYGDLYDHGGNEGQYTQNLLASAFAVQGVPVAKVMPPAPSLRKKLESVHTDDDVLDINSMSVDKLMASGADLLHSDITKQASEDLSYINGQRDAGIADKFAAVDHGLDAREAAKNAENAEYAKQSEEKSAGLADRIEQTYASLNIPGIEANGRSEKADEASIGSDYF